MATESHKVHTNIQKLPFVCFGQDMKAIIFLQGHISRFANTINNLN